MEGGGKLGVLVVDTLGEVDLDDQVEDETGDDVEELDEDDGEVHGREERVVLWGLGRHVPLPDV